MGKLENFSKEWILRNSSTQNYTQNWSVQSLLKKEHTHDKRGKKDDDKKNVDDKRESESISNLHKEITGMNFFSPNTCLQ